jgi:hypothetical protein
MASNAPVIPTGPRSPPTVASFLETLSKVIEGYF